jgi:hypothetical protein
MEQAGEIVWKYSIVGIPQVSVPQDIALKSTLRTLSEALHEIIIQIPEPSPELLPEQLLLTENWSFGIDIPVDVKIAVQQFVEFHLEKIENNTLNVRKKKRKQHQHIGTDSFFFVIFLSLQKLLTMKVKSSFQPLRSFDTAGSFVIQHSSLGKFLLPISFSVPKLTEPDGEISIESLNLATVGVQFRIFNVFPYEIPFQAFLSGTHAPLFELQPTNGSNQKKKFHLLW